MPGMFGAFNCSLGTAEGLRNKFLAVWPTAESHTTHGGVIGAHAFQNSAVLKDGQRIIAFDGEAQMYRDAWKQMSQPAVPWFEISSGRLTLSELFTGNVAIYEHQHRSIHLASDWSGAFPLYYASFNGGLLFSSHLRPLIHVLDGPTDDIGILEYLGSGYSLAGRTMVSGIHRLRPGQTLAFHLTSGKCELSDGNHPSGSLSDASTERHPVSIESLWEALHLNTVRSVPENLPHALMFSGGWDSRTMLPSIVERVGYRNLTAYSHGDVTSREIRIASRICSSLGLSHIVQPISAETLDIGLIRQQFNKVETAIFPHWHRAGKILAEAGISSASAGVYGEILGGHYGPTFVGTHGQRIRALLASLFGASLKGAGIAADSVEDAASLLRVGKLRRNWYFSRDFWDSIEAPDQQINADVETVLQRYVSRGVVSTFGLLEAYFSEYRAAQRVAAQLLSCRANLDVSFPLVGNPLLEQLSSVPMEKKIHNQLNQRLLKYGAPELLKYPMAATLLRANRPIILQEASRGLRKGIEKLQQGLHGIAGGIVPQPHYGWVNFEFLRTSDLLEEVAADLQLGIWDRDQIREVVSATRQSPDKPMHPLFDQIMKIYSADLMLRSE